MSLNGTVPNVYERRFATEAELEAFQVLVGQLSRKEQIEGNLQRLVYQFDDMVVDGAFVLDSDHAVKSLFDTTQEFLVALPATKMADLSAEVKDGWKQFLAKLCNCWQEWPLQLDGKPLFESKEATYRAQTHRTQGGENYRYIYHSQEAALGGGEGLSVEAHIKQLEAFMKENHFSAEYYIDGTATTETELKLEIRLEFYADIDAGIPDEVKL